jgi:hypothetical protein
MSQGDSIRTLFVPRIIPITYSLQLSADNEAVIKALHKFTKKAEAGKIHGMCFTAALIDQTYDFEAVGSYDRFPSEAIGPLEVLKLKLTRKALDEP